MMPRVIGGAYRLEDVVVLSPAIARGRDLQRDALVDVEIASLASRTAWSGVDRLERTAHALASEPLTPSLPRVHGLVHEESGLAFLVREAMLGGTLAERAAEAKCTEAATSALLRGLLEAVETLHALAPPVCHGSIAPELVFFRAPSELVPVLVGFDAAYDDFAPPTCLDDLRALAATIVATSLIPKALRALLDDLANGRVPTATMALERLKSIDRASSRGRRARRARFALASFALALALAIGSMALVVHGHPRASIAFSAAPAEPAADGAGCLLQSSPPGAEVYALDGRTLSDDDPPPEARLGTTPLRVSRPTGGSRVLLVMAAEHRPTVISVLSESRGSDGSAEDCSLLLPLIPR